MRERETEREREREREEGREREGGGKGGRETQALRHRVTPRNWEGSDPPNPF